MLNIIQWEKSLGTNPQNLLENSRGVFVINRILLVEAKVIPRQHFEGEPRVRLKFR